MTITNIYDNQLTRPIFSAFQETWMQLFVSLAELVQPRVTHDAGFANVPVEDGCQDNRNEVKNTS